MTMSEYVCDSFAYEQKHLARDCGLDEPSGAYYSVYDVVVKKSEDEYDGIHECGDRDEAYEVMNEYKNKHQGSIVSIESREFYQSIYS